MQKAFHGGHKHKNILEKEEHGGYAAQRSSLLKGSQLHFIKGIKHAHI